MTSSFFILQLRLELREVPLAISIDTKQHESEMDKVVEFHRPLMEPAVRANDLFIRIVSRKAAVVER